MNGKFDELISKYDSITNTHQTNELIKFDINAMYKKIISIESEIELLKNKQRIAIKALARLYVDYINCIEPEILQNTECDAIAANCILNAKFKYVAQSYRIAKRRTKTNIETVIIIINFIKKYNDFITKIAGLINMKDYANAKQLLYPNLALYKEELNNLMIEHKTPISIISILNSKVDKYIDILKRH
jgi:hypothetical protein